MQFRSLVFFSFLAATLHVFGFSLQRTRVSSQQHAERAESCNMRKSCTRCMNWTAPTSLVWRTSIGSWALVECWYTQRQVVTVFTFNVTFNFDNKRLCANFKAQREKNPRSHAIQPELVTCSSKARQKKNSIYPQGKATQCHSSFATVKKNVKSKNIPCVERANLRTTKRSFNEPNNLRWGHGSDMIWVFGGAHETNDSPECNTNSRRLVCWPLVEAAMALDSLPLCC